MNIIFGAGATGKKALMKYNMESIELFVDNDASKDGTTIQGIPVVHFEKAIDRLKDAHIIIACKAWETIADQLKEYGISDYEVYGNVGYIDIPELILNTYEDSELVNKEWMRVEINKQVKAMAEDVLFNHVEIETVNRCNGICSFCPVNRNQDPREYKMMDIEIFKKIIDELSELNYDGKLALFSNNEPLLDDRIIELHKYAREKLPNARMHLCTNGTLLTMEIFNSLMLYLDELIIDNYNAELKVIPSVQKIVDCCEKHEELKRKVTVLLRKPDEVLTNRGGDAPNANFQNDEGATSCLLPFKQMIIRPDGKVSLCCNDALGRCTLGDASKESLQEIWFGHKFKHVREFLKEGRANFARCKNCDTIFLC